MKKLQEPLNINLREMTRTQLLEEKDLVSFLEKNGRNVGKLAAQARDIAIELNIMKLDGEDLMAHRILSLEHFHQMSMNNLIMHKAVIERLFNFNEYPLEIYDALVVSQEAVEQQIRVRKMKDLIGV